MNTTRTHELIWNLPTTTETAVRMQYGGSNGTERVLLLDSYDTTKWTDVQWQKFNDNTDLLWGSDENPGSLYAIDVRALDELVGKADYYCDDDNYKEVGEPDLRESYKRVVVSVTDGGQLLVVSAG